MRLPALVFPRTALRRSLFCRLWPLCEPVQVLQPAGLSAPAMPSPLMVAGLVEMLSPPAEAGGAPDQRQMNRLLGQWEAWAAQHRGGALAEALKAGLDLPAPERETYHELRQDIRAGRPEVKPLLAAAPQLSDDLFLRLMQLQDQEAAQMEELQARVESGQERLSRIIGLEEDDVLPADYDEPFWQKLPPLDYDFSADPHLERRLKAWAGLASRAEAPPAYLATADLEAVQWLMATVNRRLLPQESAGRSPAGAEAFAPAAPGPANQDLPLAQEAARLVLPSLEHLDDERLLEVGQGLAREGVLAQMRQGLNNLLARLASEPWSPSLAQELALPARMLAQALTDHLESLGLELGAPSRGLSILALPGYSRQQVLGLMAGRTDLALPDPAAWPGSWPAGSCPLLAAW